MILYVIRHAQTAWNLEKKVQGRTDIPLLALSQQEVKNWRLPKTIKREETPCFTSPLQRCVETARLLGFQSAKPVQALIEMDWGEGEGKTIEEHRAIFGELFIEEEKKGLDFNFFQKESPRDVQKRVFDFLKKEQQKKQEKILCITHKGVIRTLFAAALEWDMRSKPPQKLIPNCIHSFNCIDYKGHLKITPYQLNQPL